MKITRLKPDVEAKIHQKFLKCLKPLGGPEALAEGLEENPNTMKNRTNGNDRDHPLFLTGHFLPAVRAMPLKQRLEIMTCINQVVGLGPPVTPQIREAGNDLLVAFGELVTAIGELSRELVEAQKEDSEMGVDISVNEGTRLETARVQVLVKTEEFGGAVKQAITLFKKTG